MIYSLIIEIGITIADGDTATPRRLLRRRPSPTVSIFLAMREGV